MIAMICGICCGLIVFYHEYRINKAEEKIRLLLERSLNVIESIENLNILSEKKGDENNE